MIKMKKTMFVVVALFLIASLMFCGCKKAEEPATPSEETEVDEDLSELADLDEDLNLDDLEDIEKELEGLDW